MKNKLNFIATVLIASTMILLSSCKKDKNVYADDFAITMAENPSNNQEIGTVIATTEKGYITYTLTSQSPVGSLNIDASSGTLSVNDATLFNYEINPIITATVEASNGKNSAISNVTITLSDVYEVPAIIGDFRDGGIVFWVNPTDNTQGLVCAVQDQAISSAEWGCFDILNPIEINGADGSAVGTGAQNTIDIEAGCSSPGTAADLCSNLTLNSYTDWFLPSRDEMTEMYSGKATINAAAVANGGTSFDEAVLYWSSTEFSPDKAYDFYFLNGISEETLKLNYFSVRAVRAF